MIESPGAEEFDELAAALETRGAKRGQMMGSPMLSVGGRMFACLHGLGFAVKLGRETQEFAEALDLPGASVFSPGPGRSFHDWVSLPVDAADDWPRFADAAKDYTASRSAKR